MIRNSSRKRISNKKRDEIMSVGDDPIKILQFKLQAMVKKLTLARKMRIKK